MFNVNKPGKLRFVFDAAANIGSTSLNDALLPGPDLLNPLVGVLIRFRQYTVAFAADIKEMFHQINIRRDLQPAQRFLWRSPGTTWSPDTYVMQVMIFGAVSSPCSAQYVMRKNAEEQGGEFPDVQQATSNNYYMDDYLDSMPTVEEAVKRVADTIEVQSRGGFVIRNWVSNSSEVLKSVPESMRAAGSVDLTSRAVSCSTFLGYRVWVIFHG